MQHCDKINSRLGTGQQEMNWDVPLGDGIEDNIGKLVLIIGFFLKITLTAMKRQNLARHHWVVLFKHQQSPRLFLLKPGLLKSELCEQ